MYWENTSTAGPRVGPAELERGAQALVGEGRRHPDVRDHHVRPVPGHRGQQRLAVGHRGAHLVALGRSSSRTSPARNSAASSAITMRISGVPARERELDGDPGRPAGRAGDLQRGRRPTATRWARPDRPLPRAGFGPAEAVIGYPEGEKPSPFGHEDLDRVRLAVLGRVGQQFGGAEVGDRLDRRGRPDRDARRPARPGWRWSRPGRPGRRRGRCPAPAGGCRGPARAARPGPPWRCRCAASTSSRAAARSGTVPWSPSFSLAMPRFMASVASRICAPSCRSRSSRRSRAAASSTARARVCSRSRTRWAMRPGPSRPRMSQRSAATTPAGHPRGGQQHASPGGEDSERAGGTSRPGSDRWPNQSNGGDHRHRAQRARPAAWLRNDSHQNG